MAMRKSLKFNYFGFLGLLGFLGFVNPWYFLFFLFFLFFLVRSSSMSEGGFGGNKGAEKLDEFNKAREEKAKESKEKILSFIAAQDGVNPRIRNNDVQELLGVSDATATRYLDELQADGKINQVGEGSASYYELLK